MPQFSTIFNNLLGDPQFKSKAMSNELVCEENLKGMFEERILDMDAVS